MRYAVSAFMVIHGLVHTLGFMAAFRWAELPLKIGTDALSPYSIKLVGLLWLAAAAGLLTSAAALALHWPGWWIVGLVALALSQGLIVCAWSDAKAGTWLNALLLVPLLAGAAHAAFGRDSRRAIEGLLHNPSRATASPIQAAELTGLPRPVAHWLVSAGVVGRTRPRSVWLRQAGELRTAPDGDWMPAAAEQRFRIDRPGFVWSVHVRMKGVLPIDGRDTYLNGHGRMLIKALSLVPIVDASDAQTDQGTLLRYLGEMVWFPAAALEPYIHWQALDAHSAKATMSYEHVTASATFEFDREGRVTRVSAERYMGSGPDAKRLPWTIPLQAWQKLSGIVVPVQGAVFWQLESGPFEYYRWRITELAYDPESRIGL
jgi:hypothetical protein